MVHKINKGRLMDFTFAAIDLGITSNEKLAMLQEVKSIPDEMHHYNKFRGCKMLGIYNGGGRLGGRVKGIDTKTGEFKYTPAGELCPTIKKVCEEKIFPFMNTPGRVTILRTQPDYGLKIHLDSKLEEVGTRQHKFRLVLHGEIDKLFFVDKNYNNVYVPDLYDCYTMDGSHPHSIDPGKKEKITLCIGAPWHGESNELYNTLINNSVFKMKVDRPIEVPTVWLDPFFEVNKNKKVEKTWQKTV